MNIINYCPHCGKKSEDLICESCDGIDYRQTKAYQDAVESHLRKELQIIFNNETRNGNRIDKVIELFRKYKD